MRNLLARLRSHPALVRQAGAGVVMLAMTVAAFYCGRLGVTAQVDAQAPAPAPAAGQLPSGPGSDYSRRVVAYLYENVPITREALGEYLIARFGEERVQFLINRRIVEKECQAKGIYCTDLQVETQFKEDLKGFGLMSAKDFNDQILKRFNKSIYEWKEDVIRPRLLMAQLCKPMVQVTAEGLYKAFEAHYGPKVQCRMIVFAQGDTHASEIWQQISKSEAEFAKYAKQQFIPDLAAKGGVIPPIHKHFGTNKPEEATFNKRVEESAFALKPGEVTALMEMPDKTSIVLKCDQHLLADATTNFDTVKLDLEKEIREAKLALKIPEVFAELRKHANPRVLITSVLRQEDMERGARRELTTPNTGLAPRPTGLNGN